MQIFLKLIFLLLIGNNSITSPNSIIVSGSAMFPTLVNGQRITINKIDKNFIRGDIIIFKYPKDQSQLFIKRIVGLPGESLQIKNESVYINDLKIDESGYLPAQVKTYGNAIGTTLKNDEYFVLGDNRTASSDSRIWGALKRELIVGKYVK